MSLPPGTEGYAENAAALVESWRRLSFRDRPPEVLALLTGAPTAAVDIGAGIGTDAAGLAGCGHRVTAVEPVAAFRQAGTALHRDAGIEWLDDSLPLLATLSGRRGEFGIVLLAAVWMHLEENERRQAMATVAALLAPDGVLVMSLRHGPVPAGRRMFEVTARETVALGRAHGLAPILVIEAASVQQANHAAGVNWTHLGFAIAQD